MKDNYLRIRLSERDKNVIKSRSEALQMSMSEYLIYLVRKDQATQILNLSTSERQAISKAISTLGFEDNDERVQDWLSDDTISINTCRNGRDAAWVVLDDKSVAVYTDTLEELTEDEIESELC